MKFRKDNKARYRNWHSWWAWHPVSVKLNEDGSEDIIVFKRVMRRLVEDFLPMRGTFNYWEYKECE